MKIDNIKATILVMEKALDHRSLDMLRYQTDVGSGIKYNMGELHACGNRACLAGHIALMPEFHAQGGLVCSDGAPTMKRARFPGDSRMPPQQAVAEWFGIPVGIAWALTHDCRAQEDSSRHRIYRDDWINVGPNHVIEVLEELMDIGVQVFAEKYFMTR